MSAWRVDCGDALDLLAALPPMSVDAFVTDPPYGINTKSDGTGKLNPWADLCNAALWYREWLGLCRRALKPSGSIWSFLNWRSLPTFQKAGCDLGWPIESLAIWNKQWIGPGGPRGLRPSYEMVALWGMPDFKIEDRGIPDLFLAEASGYKATGHPAEKPEKAIRWILDALSLSAGSLVVDPFSGSGTVGTVARQRGLEFIGFELDERWATSSRLRIDAADKQGSLLLARAAP